MIVAFLLWRQYGPGLPRKVAYGYEAVAKAYAERRTHLMTEFSGRVQRILPDDLNPPPHQRFTVVLDNGHVLLITHNLDLAGRIPLREWDPISIRGEYEWNDQGGLVHWTHRDPYFGLKQGWIEYRGKLYD